MKLANQVVAITGGNSGIGLATAEYFQSLGAKVAIFGRNADTLAAAQKQLGDGALVVKGDITNLDDVESLFKQTKERFGAITTLFANAGVARFIPFEEITPEAYDFLTDINIKGTFFTVQKALPYLAEKASIILTGSAVHQKGFAGSSVYSITKAALRSLSRTLALELAPRGIRVNTISPGPIETPIFDTLGMPAEAQEEFAKNVIETIPLGRFGQAIEVAKVAAFLASDDSSYIVGADLTPDGGLTSV